MRPETCSYRHRRLAFGSAMNVWLKVAVILIIVVLSLAAYGGVAAWFVLTFGFKLGLFLFGVCSLALGEVLARLTRKPSTGSLVLRWLARRLRGG